MKLIPIYCIAGAGLANGSAWNWLSDWGTAIHEHVFAPPSLDLYGGVDDPVNDIIDDEHEKETAAAAQQEQDRLAQIRRAAANAEEISLAEQIDLAGKAALAKRIQLANDAAQVGKDLSVKRAAELRRAELFETTLGHLLDRDEAART